MTYALSFDGVNDLVTVPVNAAFHNSNNWTYEAMVNIGPNMGQAPIMSYDTSDSGLNGKGVHLVAQPNGAVSITKGSGDGSWESVTSPTGVLKKNTWHHVAATYDSAAGNAGLKIYVDGVLVATSTSIDTHGTNYVNATGLTIASHPQGSGTDLFGRLLVADVRIWSVTRTQTQIADNRNARLVGNESGLVGYWKLNEGTGTTATDAVAGRNGTFTNEPTWNTSGPGFPGEQTAVGVLRRFASSFVKKIDGTGTQEITGVGFTPKVLIAIATGNRSASGTWDSSIGQSIGLSAGPANSLCISGASQDAVATTQTQRRMSTSLVTITNELGTVVAECDLQSFTADGFIVNWVVNNTSPYNIVFIALDADGMEAKVIQWNTPTAAGNKVVDKVGFQSDLVINIGSVVQTLDSSGTTMVTSLGVMNKRGQQWANAVYAVNANGVADTSHVQRMDSGWLWCEFLNIIDRAVLKSMDVDGFTMEFAPAGAASRIMGSLCIKGVSSEIFAIAQPSANGNKSYPLDIAPKLLMFSGISSTPSASASSYGYWNIGVADGTRQRLLSQADVDNMDPTDVMSLFRNDRATTSGYSSARDVGAEVGYATLVSLDSGGFTLDWQGTDVNPREHVCVALGDAGADTFPVTAVA